MKILFVVISLILTIACNNSNSNGGSNADSTSRVPGNSAGAITVSADTAHMDTSLGRIMTDSAK